MKKNQNLIRQLEEENSLKWRSINNKEKAFFFFLFCKKN